MENYLVINKDGKDYNGAYQERFKEYLISNASDELKEKIKSSGKNLYDCFLYVMNEVKNIYIKQYGQNNGGIYMSDEDVFNMVIHYFQEDSIEIVKEETKHSRVVRDKQPVEKTNKEEKPVKKTVKEPKKENAKENKGFEQISLFDMF